MSCLQSSLLSYFGASVLAYYVVRLAYKLLNNLYIFMLSDVINLKKYGSWAIVTGCTDGIGKAYAEKLAKKGLNIVLISRTQSKLDDLARDIETKFNVKTKTIAADFTQQDTIYEVVREGLEGLDIGTLVNNVGMSYDYPEFFGQIENSNEFINKLINCNITSVTKMTAICLPGMIERKKGGIIINNASSSGRFPTPLLTVYSSTKAYVDFFSRGLQQEYRLKGIIVQSLCPFFVVTKLSKMRPSLLAPNPQTYVSAALKTIGKQSITNGCLVHNIQGWVFEELLPEGLRTSLVFKQLLTARNRALKKKSSTKSD